MRRSHEAPGGCAGTGGRRSRAGRAFTAVALLVATLVAYAAPASAASFGVIATIPGQAAGPYAVAFDTSTNIGYLASNDGSVSVFDPGTNAVTATIAVPGFPTAIAVDSGTHRVYVTSFTTPGSVTVIDGTTNTVVTTIATADNATDVAVDPLTHTVYVTVVGDESVYVIDPVTNMITDKIFIGLAPQRDFKLDPRGVAVDPIRRELWVTEQSYGIVTILDQDTLAITDRIVLTEAATPADAYRVAIDTVNDTVYVTDPFLANGVTVIDQIARTVTAFVSLPGQSFNVAVDPATRTVFVPAIFYYGSSVQIIDGATDTVAGTVDTPGSGYGVAFNADNGYVYVTGIGRSGGRTVLSVLGPVQPVNEAPVALGQDVETDQEQPVAIILEADDPEDDPLTFSVVSGPANGTLSGTAPNLTYAPDPGYYGPDSFDFTADDGAAESQPATVSIDVRPAAVGNEPQAITFVTAPPADAQVGGSYVVSAVGGGSGNPVNFAVDATSTAGACSIADNGDSTAGVAFTGPGTCVINADQAGAEGYDAAPQRQQTIAIQPAPGPTSTPPTPTPPTTTSPATAPVATALPAAGGTTVSAPPAAAQLAATGASNAATALLAAVFVACGAAMIAAGRRGAAAAHR